MKRSLLFLFLVMMAATSAFGAGLCVDNIGTDVVGAVGFYCTMGPLIFSDFSASQGGLGQDPEITLAAGTGLLGDVAVLYFTTNFDAVTATERDISFVFQVTGPIDAVDAYIGGSGSRNIFENVCITAACDDPADPVAFIYIDETNPSAEVPIPMSYQAWISKDITVAGGASLPEFSQSFHTVPEPLAMVLMGTGLLGLGLLRRRLRN